MAQADDREEAIAKRERELYDAMIAEDYVRLDGLLAEDCTYVHSTGVQETKAAYLQGVKKGLYEYESVEARGAAFHVGDDMAMVTATVRMVVGERGKPKNVVPLLSTLVWIRQGGDWQLLRRHATRIPEK